MRRSASLPGRAHRPRTVAVVLLAGLLGLPAPARAQAAEADTTQEETAADAATPQGRALRFLESLAKDRFNQAVIQDDRALLEQALDALQLGMRLSQAPGFVFNAALVERRLGRCGEAAELFQRFLARPTSAKTRERAEHELAALSSCKEPEPDALISVLPDVEIGLREPGAAALASRVAVRWEELSESPASSSPQFPEIAFWSLAGATALSATVAGISLGQAWSAHDDLQSPPSDARAAEHLVQVQKDGRHAQTRARWFGALAAGFGLAAGGVYWLSHAPTRAESGSTGLRIVAEPSTLGAVWSGSF